MRPIGAGFSGNGCVGRRRLARNGALGDGPFLDAPDGLTGHAVEEEDRAHLRDDRERRDRLAVARDVDERRRGREIEVPEVVVHELVEPLELPGRGVEGDDAVGVEVVALAVAAVVVGRRRAGRREHEAALFVDREERPHVGPGPVLPAVAFPGLDAGLPRARHRVERPQQLAGARVPAADVAVEAEARRLLAVVAARDDDVLEDGRRREEGDAAVHVAANLGLEVDRSGVAELGDRRAGLRVEGDHLLARADDDAAAPPSCPRASTRRRAG